MRNPSTKSITLAVTLAAALAAAVPTPSYAAAKRGAGTQTTQRRAEERISPADRFRALLRWVVELAEPIIPIPKSSGDEPTEPSTPEPAAPPAAEPIIPIPN